MLVKCRFCGRKIDRSIAHKIVERNKNIYFCNQDEAQQYLNIQEEKQKEKERKSAIYDLISEIFGYTVINTILFKEVEDVLKVFNSKLIIGYLQSNKDYLETVMLKDFSSEYAMIRYFFAIIKNNLKDYKDRAEVIKKVDYRDESIETNYVPKGRRKSLDSYEVGDIV